MVLQDLASRYTRSTSRRKKGVLVAALHVTMQTHSLAKRREEKIRGERRDREERESER